VTADVPLDAGHAHPGWSPVGCAVIGCGRAAAEYLDTLTASPWVTVLVCCDLDPSRAATTAAAHALPHTTDVPAVFGDPRIRLVVNLTPPAAHAEVALQAVAASKSVYNEKPLTVDPADAARLLADADSHGALVGSAPDTFLAPAAHAAREAIDLGLIGEPVAAAAATLSQGPERWRPDPELFYQPGAGPLFDMGPYYLTTLVALLGPVTHVAGAQSTRRSPRMIRVGPHASAAFQARTATHLTAMLRFASGVPATLVTSFDAPATRTPHIEILGTDATLVLPDPNFFHGTTLIRRRDSRDWQELPNPVLPTLGRGAGVIDLAHALATGTGHRATGHLGAHVLDVMTAIGHAADTGAAARIRSTVGRPPPLTPLGRGCPWCAALSRAGE
jgi:predicted dehydrogenase